MLLLSILHFLGWIVLTSRHNSPDSKSPSLPFGWLSHPRIQLGDDSGCLIYDNRLPRAFCWDPSDPFNALQRVYEPVLKCTALERVYEDDNSWAAFPRVFDGVESEFVHRGLTRSALPLPFHPARLLLNGYPCTPPLCHVDSVDPSECCVHVCQHWLISGMQTIKSVLGIVLDCMRSAFFLVTQMLIGVAALYGEWAAGCSRCLLAIIGTAYEFDNRPKLLAYDIYFRFIRRVTRRSDFKLERRSKLAVRYTSFALVQLLSCSSTLYACRLGKRAICKAVLVLAVYSSSLNGSNGEVHSRDGHVGTFYRIGGGRMRDWFDVGELTPYVMSQDKDAVSPSFNSYKFSDHLHKSALRSDLQDSDPLVCHIPLSQLATRVPISTVKNIGRQHDIFIPARMQKPAILDLLSNHTGPCCRDHVTIFVPCKAADSSAERSQRHRKGLNEEAKQKLKERRRESEKERWRDTDYKIQKAAKQKQVRREDKSATSASGKSAAKMFPPRPPTERVSEEFVRRFCKATSPSSFQETGCATCGQLVPLKDLVTLEESGCDIDKALSRDVQEYTRMERFSEKDPIRCIPGPVMDRSCRHVCKPCQRAIRKGNVPKFALARGLWLGDVPQQLQCLKYFERLLVSRIRHNRCVFRVSTGSSKVNGMSKMVANAITFKHPVQKIYSVLPPALDELDDIVAFIYTGPTQPTPEDFSRTPLLVRRKKVVEALEWLKLNHRDYRDLEISYKNLEDYPEDVPPVVIDYRRKDTNKNPEATSVHDTELEDGTRSGECSLTVHGLTGEQYADASPQALKAIALDHLDNMGKIVAVGRAEKPESIWHNPALYPQMFPWLFPYGLGGIGESFHKGVMSDAAHKRHLLMYHDKRFQKDHEFCLIAFNHEQIKDCTTGGYLMADRSNFEDVANRLLQIDTAVLKDLSRRLSSGDRVKAESDEERACYDILKDIDHVGGHVSGSITNKKYMRNEIWSLTSFQGAPSWYVTLSPADNKHPICLYFADNKEEFKPDIRIGDDRLRLISENPVAGARFFHFMIDAFIQHVLGVRKTSSGNLERGDGIFGSTSAYYGTVEQQGRLTLHLHMLIWVKNSLTPQEIRDRIMDEESDFQRQMVQYLEGCHIGEFLTGSQEQVQKQVNSSMIDDEYADPTQTIAEPPPKRCSSPSTCGGCKRCADIEAWRLRFKTTVDDILLRSNVHTCKGGPTEYKKKLAKERGKSKNEQEKYTPYTGCKSNKWGKCKARFPREVFPQTMVNPNTGALDIKKGEKWMNTFNTVVSYLFRCNTDVTSLLSGTAIKAVVAYISDYITKPSLKTYAVFDTVRSVFDKNSDIIGGSPDRKETTRRVLTQIVNSLTAKMEIGAPMAAMYLLNNPDHYTDHKFRTFYWRSYVFEARKPWAAEDLGLDDQRCHEKLMINKRQGKIVGLTPVQDYIYRPVKYKDMCLYDWIRLHVRKPKPKPTKKEPVQDHVDDSEPDELDVIGGGRSASSNEDLEGSLSDTTAFSEDDASDTNTLIGGKSFAGGELNDDDDDRSQADDSSTDVCSDGDGDCFDDSCDEDELNIGDEAEAIEDPSQYYDFLPDHPLCGTHHALCASEAEEFVPNFIGGPLPRSDRGDREYYCSSMLALFKPWRVGTDLKNDNQSWDDGFNQYKFSDRQTTLMKYFNLRYECLDARDDFSAELKKGEGKGIFDKFDEDYDMDDEDHHDTRPSGGDDSHYDHDRIVIDDRTGRATQNMQNKMKTMRNMMAVAGWFDDSPDGLPDYGDLIPLEPAASFTGKEWERKVAEKKEEVMSSRMKDAFSGGPEHATEEKGRSFPEVTDDVKIVDKRYLEKSFKSASPEEQAFIDDTVSEYELNEEQERAFRIVANHATVRGQEQLKMYLGGMGGTGKSQVIKALVSFFKRRKESHRIIIMAPTGSAAALLAGHTYHSVLGIREDVCGAKNIAQVRAKMEGVDYMFLDEVSMLSCHDMYRICSQMAKAFNAPDLPFGGKNVIFAGDFAQLPPVTGREASSLYSGCIGTQVHSGLKNYDQESAIGKALWHQITTVVILRKNMRQKHQSAEDTKFRTALENMRYKSCTPDDISFLRSRVVGPGPNRPKLAEKRFRNVAIITAMNAQKDVINQEGCLKFAASTGQQLTHFYSYDKWTEYEYPQEQSKRNRKRRKRATRTTHKSTNIIEEDQERLWDLPHSASDHTPGKLSLCIGMPVIVRYNTATELCITKGQEGTVAGWHFEEGPYGRKILETLFVRLSNPPNPVKFDFLPENVVPITKRLTSTTCRMRDDQLLKIDRLQVPVLPNFAMTDYASQGKTRPNNVVDLSNCTSHQSYYTALSRSATASGTAIFATFVAEHITGGASGWLRQEFRELELLDDITDKRYHSGLPAHINAHRRNTLIRQYREWKGLNYMPGNTHGAIQWSRSKPYNMHKIVTDSPWQVVDKDSKKVLPDNDPHQKKIADGSIPTVHNKRKREGDGDQESDAHVNVGAAKKLRPDDGSIADPIGLTWDAANYSCAYDALFSVLHYTWATNPHKWNRIFKELNPVAVLMVNGFQKALGGSKSMEEGRDAVRAALHKLDNVKFPWGQAGTSIGSLSREIFRKLHGISVQYECNKCRQKRADIGDEYLQALDYRYDPTLHTVTDAIKSSLQQTNGVHLCGRCHSEESLIQSFSDAPKILCINNLGPTMRLEREMRIKSSNGRNTVLHLRGLIYHGDFHFVSRTVCLDGTVWFHDGMVTRDSMERDGTIRHLNTGKKIWTCRGKNLTAVIYAQK